MSNGATTAAAVPFQTQHTNGHPSPIAAAAAGQTPFFATPSAATAAATNIQIHNQVRHTKLRIGNITLKTLSYHNA